MKAERGLLILSLACALGAAGTSCGQNASTTDATTTSAEPEPIAVVSVSAVELGRGVDADKRVTDRVEVFAPKDVIYASVLTAGAAPNAVLKARWLMADGTVVEETEQIIAPTGPAVTEFHISKPDGMPAGKYKVEVLLDGVPVKTQEFEVK